MEKGCNQAEIQSGFTALACKRKYVLKKPPVLCRAVGRSWHPPTEAAGAQLLCDPWAVPGMAPAVGHTKSLGVPIGDFLLLGSFPAMAMLPALPVLADMEQQCYHDVFPLTGCWKRQY